jgi:hypothetical protein
MDLPGQAVFLINAADLSGDDKAGGGLVRVPGGDWPRVKADLRFESVKTFGCRLQAGGNLREPARVSAVAGTQKGDAFIRSPKVQLLQIQLTTGGPGKMGVDVEIGDEGHD